MVMRRLLGALFLALLISGLFTFLLARKLRSTRPETAALVRYVTVTRDIDAGEILKPEDIAQVNWPASSSVHGAVLQAADALGRAVLSPLSQGQPLLSRQLSAVGGFGLSARIPAGMRAISLRSDQVVGVAGFLLPGTHIDVLVTYRAVGLSDPITSTVMQNAEVLATGQKTQPDPDGKPATTDVVTLLVTPADAERLVLASSQGTIHFLLRNGAEREGEAPRPVDIATLGLRTSSTLPVSPERRPAPPKHQTPQSAVHSADPPYSVTVVRGDKQTVETF